MHEKNELPGIIAMVISLHWLYGKYWFTKLYRSSKYWQISLKKIFEEHWYHQKSLGKKFWETWEERQKFSRILSVVFLKMIGSFNLRGNICQTPRSGWITSLSVLSSKNLLWQKLLVHLSSQFSHTFFSRQHSYFSVYQKC